MATWSEKVFKGYLMLQFSWLSEFPWGKFFVCLTSSSMKTAEAIDFKLCTHISKRLLHKRMPAIFVKTSYWFYCNALANSGSAFWTKTIKSKYLKNIWKEEKRGTIFVRILVRCISVKKNYRKTAILLVQELIK